MRAPEVYQGLGCFHSSTVWALFATISLLDQAWCLWYLGQPKSYVPRGLEYSKAHAALPALDWPA